MFVELVALDLETTGLDPQRDSIIEIGAVRMRDGQVVDEYSQLVNPGVHLPREITDITGIGPEQLVGQPAIEDVLSEVVRFVADVPVIGHNVNFDMDFLARQGVLRGNLRLDTAELAAVLLPRASRYSLGNLAAETGIELQQAHRALDDARATAGLYWKLWQKALQLPVATLNEIVSAASGLGWNAEPVFRAALEAQGLLSSPEAGQTAHGNTLYPPLEDSTPLPPPDNAPLPLDGEEIQQALRAGGALARRLDGFRERPQQITMAQEVTQAFNQGEHLMIEAGTGVGKTLAYLLPAARWSQVNSRRVIISTNTINLQEQLLNKDLPLMQETLSEPLRSALLKGRGNYLCPRRFTALRRRKPVNEDELRVLCKSLVWLLENQSGDRNEISLRGPGDRHVWSRLSAEDPLCSLDRCRSEMKGTCPFFKARRSAESAHLVVVNHALLLADAASDHHVLPHYTSLILDEAQHLEEAVSEAFAFHLDERSLRLQLAELGSANSGALGELLRASQGQVARSVGNRLREVIDTIGEAASLLLLHASRLFSACRKFATDVGPARSNYTTRLRIVPPLREHNSFDPVVERHETLSGFFYGISDALNRLTGQLGPLAAGADGELLDSLNTVENISRWFVLTRQQLEAWVEKPEDNRVYWLEIAADRGNAVTMHATPLHVGPLVEEHLWESLETIVLTSATLRSAGNFDFLRERLSAGDHRAREVGSPFDYRASTLLFVPSDIPEPAQREGYQAAVERGLVELAAALDGRLLALFTSYSQLRQTAQGITPRLALGGIEVLSQRGGSSRSALLQAFREREKAVLLGTRSFWEGVDIPGDDLRALVIVRLPFAVPSDPVFAARSDTFTDSFNDYAVPDAILRFRQGFGRLIRSHEDRGIVAIFDRRVLSKRYGQQFLNDLPDCTRVSAPLATLPQEALRWLSLG